MVVFTVTLSTVAAAWNKPGQLEHSEWVNTVWSIRTMTIYSVIKINGIVVFTGNIFNENWLYLRECVLGSMPLCPRPLYSLPSSCLFFFIFSASSPSSFRPALPTLGHHKISSFLLPHPLTLMFHPHHRPQSNEVNQPRTENF